LSDSGEAAHSLLGTLRIVRIILTWAMGPQHLQEAPAALSGVSGKDGVWQMATSKPSDQVEEKD
jgi:hypothetical protein